MLQNIKLSKQDINFWLVILAGAVVLYFAVKAIRKKIIAKRTAKEFSQFAPETIDAKAYAILFYNAMHGNVWNGTDEEQLISLISQIPSLNAFNQVAEQYAIMYPKVRWVWQTGSSTGTLLGDITEDLSDTPDTLNTFMNILKSKK